MLHHVALETRPADIDACVAFWALLGFEVVDPPATLRDRATWVERDGQQIHLMLADDPVTMPSGHVAVVEPAYEAVVERLRAAGHEVDPREPHWGAPRCFVLDPAGHRVEVMAFAP